MREILNINSGWKFIKTDVGESKAKTEQGEMVDLPHTWNGTDGQDGGNDYYRGTCWYTREFDKPEASKDNLTYLEFKGVNSSCEVFINDKSVFVHHGGYSTFRVNVTKFLTEHNLLILKVDNSKTEKVYPQTADFTFYGGIYRDVNILTVAKNHFDLDFFGSSGIKVTPTVEKDSGFAEVQTFVTGEGEVKIFIFDAAGKEVASQHMISAVKAPVKLKIENVHRWNGIKDPYLYTVKVKLICDGVQVDEEEKNIGFRSFHFNADDGFFLNEKKYPLRGVCRHQDRPKIGNALQKAHHEEDIKLIREVGANTIRLAHYQHDDYFYDLCDKYGMVVWAEIPYISRHMPEADENAISQMKELIFQQYHHPSIVTWGLSNEITMKAASKDRYNFHIILNDLCHKLDATRLTSIACYMPCTIANKLNAIPDIVSYNLYFGWYFPFASLAGWKLDNYHKKYPTRIIGLAEYGAEGMPNLHSNHPYRGDNTEEYQTIYHQNMLKIIEKRDYLWATHQWNMFDFAADARNQGGEPGMNHKGLVTFDRKTKKDAFYLYKSYWSNEAFVHICGKRFINRTGGTATIKVYSNQPYIELYNNGKLIEKQEGKRIFTFKIDLEKENNLVAKSGELSDKSLIIKVRKKDKSYLVKKTKNVSWEK